MMSHLGTLLLAHFLRNRVSCLAQHELILTHLQSENELKGAENQCWSAMLVLLICHLTQ